MKIEYAIFDGDRCVGAGLYATSMKEVAEVIASLNTNGGKFKEFIVKIRAGV